MVSEWLPPLDSLSCDDVYILDSLDRYPGVRPICIGDILRRLMCKVLLIVVGNEATSDCGTVQRVRSWNGGGRVVMLEPYGRYMNMMKDGLGSC